MTAMVVVGDCLLDRDVQGSVSRLSPDAAAPVLDERRACSRPGGAGLAACLAAGDGHDVTLVTALSRDDAGQLLVELLDRAGVDVVDLELRGPTPEKVRFRDGDRTLLRLDRGGATGAEVGPLPPAAAEAIGRADVVVVSDYGRGVADMARLRAAVTAAPGPVVWDPHPRGARPVPGVAMVTPNEQEAALWAPAGPGGDVAAAINRGRRLRRRWRARTISVTLGARGALLVGDARLTVLAPAPVRSDADACGAGDRYATAVAGLLGDGQPPDAAVRGAVLVASHFVASGGVAIHRDGRPPDGAPAAATGAIVDRDRELAVS